MEHVRTLLEIENNTVNSTTCVHHQLRVVERVERAEQGVPTRASRNNAPNNQARGVRLRAKRLSVCCSTTMHPKIPLFLLFLPPPPPPPPPLLLPHLARVVVAREGRLPQPICAGLKAHLVQGAHTGPHADAVQRTDFSLKRLRTRMM